jgi:hypothetical protein
MINNGGRIGGDAMYEIQCETCGEIDFHPSRVAAESRAEGHVDDTGHRVDIVEMKRI